VLGLRNNQPEAGSRFHPNPVQGRCHELGIDGSGRVRLRDASAKLAQKLEFANRHGIVRCPFEQRPLLFDGRRQLGPRA